MAGVGGICHFFAMSSTQTLYDAMGDEWIIAQCQRIQRTSSKGFPSKVKSLGEIEYTSSTPPRRGAQHDQPIRRPRGRPFQGQNSTSLTPTTRGKPQRKRRRRIQKHSTCNSRDDAASSYLHYRLSPLRRPSRPLLKKQKRNLVGRPTWGVYPRDFVTPRSDGRWGGVAGEYTGIVGVSRRDA